MKAALTGTTGYIGKNLEKFLCAQGWSTIQIKRGDTCEKMKELLKAFKPDVVFHLASLFIAEHKSSEVAQLIQSNVQFGTELLEAMKESDVRTLINTGTSWQHFRDDEREPVNLYAATKTAMEEIARYYQSAERFKIVHLKLFDTYGPDDNRPKLIPKLIQCFESGVELALSPGEQELDFVHIEDVCDAFLRAAEFTIAKMDPSSALTFSVESRHRISLRQLVALLEELRGKKLSVQWGARPYRTREVMKPWSKGKTVPGWIPKVPLEVGIKRLMSGSK